MNLYHVLYVSYLLPVSRIGLHVPDEIPMSTFEPDRAFVSVVCMKCANVRLSKFPWPRFNYDQLNVRTYVKDPITGNNAVYFIQSGVTSTMTSYSTRLIGIPWQRIQFRMVLENTNDDTVYTDYSAYGNWNGEVSISASFSNSHKSHDDSLLSSDSSIEHITGPLLGFIGPAGSIMRFGIRHRALDILRGELVKIHFPILNSMGLLEEWEMIQPYSVLLVPEAEFTVLLPPRQI